MAIERVYGFIALEQDLVMYNAKAVIDLPFQFYFSDGTNYTFVGYVSGYFNIYDERGGAVIKTYTSTANISRNSNNLVLNIATADFTFNDAYPNGKYQYEMGFVQSGGYSIPLRYGKLFIV